jgi:hypothetical protein
MIVALVTSFESFQDREQLFREIVKLAILLNLDIG